MRIQNKTLLLIAGAFLLLVAVGGMACYLIVSGVIQRQSDGLLRAAVCDIRDQVATAARTSFKKRLRRAAESGRSVVEGYYQKQTQGRLTEKAAKEEAWENLVSQKIGVAGYVYCLDSYGVVLAHPQNELVGIKLSQFDHIQEQINKKTGYLEYEWKGPGEKEKRPRALYMVYFEPWDCIISATCLRSELAALADMDAIEDIVAPERSDNDRPMTYLIDGKGNLLVHPYLKEQNAFEWKDAKGNAYIKTICGRKEGSIRHEARVGEKGPVREYVDVFAYDRELDWIVVSSHLASALSIPLLVARLKLIAGAILALVAAIGLAKWIADVIAKPISRLSADLKNAAEGDLEFRLAGYPEGETAAMAQSVNALIEQLGKYRQVFQEDIAELEDAERAIEKQREFLRHVIDINPNFIFAKNRQGRYTLMNQAAADAYGVRVDDLIGKTDGELGANAAIMRDLSAGENGVFETKQEKLIPEHAIADAAGNTRWLQIIMRPLVGEGGVVDQVLTVATDITQRKLAEQDLQKAHDGLEKRVAERSKELEAAVKDLQKEVGQRRRVEKQLQQANEQLSTSVRQLEQHTREITLLNQMGDVLQACRTVEETYDVVPQIVQQLFPDDSGALCIFNAAHNVLETVGAWGEPELSESVFSKDDCWALRRGKAYSVDDAESGHVCGHLPCAPPYGYVCVPMIAEGEVLGMFHLQWGKPGKNQTEEGWAALLESKRRLSLTVTEQFALALANLKLRETLRIQSIRDPLTGLYNRRYMEESLEREARRADRKEKPLGVIMLDIDHFKQFNDTYGHDAGDHLLRDLGELLQKQVRREDIPCRYGGEEFILILPESNLRNTRRRAEQIRETVKARLRTPAEGQELKEVTISLGVAVYPDHGAAAGAVIQAADAALYEAKRNGRDRVEAAQTAKRGAEKE